MKKHISMIICTILAASIALTGCSKSSQASSNNSDNKKDEKVTVSIGLWPKDDAPDLPQSEARKAEFEKENPNITIKPDVYDYDVNTFFPKAESGQLPNIYVTWFTEATKIVDAGYAADITEELKELGWDKEINPNLLKLVQKDGKIYGIPYAGYIMGMWYNMNLFKKAGLVDENGVPKYPKTYEELAQTAKTIKDKTGKSGIFFPTKDNQGGWQFMNIAWAYGTEFEKNEGGKWKATFNSPEGVQALQYIKDLKWKYDVLQDNLLVNLGDMFKLFAADEVGMSLCAADDGPLGVVTMDCKMDRNNLSISSLPAGPKGNTALTGGSVIMFSPNSSKEQIKAGLKWLKKNGTCPEVTADSLKGFDEYIKVKNEKGNIVAPLAVKVWTNTERLKAEDEIYNKYTNVDVKLYKDYINNSDKNIKPEVPINCQELYKTLDSVIQAVLTDKNADPKTLLDKAAADFQRDYLDKVGK